MIIFSLLNWVKDNFILIAGVSAAGKWIWEYSQQRKFEKSKFLLERIEEFNSFEEVKVVNKLLDWNSIKIKYNEIEYKINDKILIEALITHNLKSEFNPTEVMIRNLFDFYFDKLNELIILRDCGLVDEKNLRRFLKYWISIMNGSKNSKSKILISRIENYLIFYGYTDVHKFLFK